MLFSMISFQLGTLFPLNQTTDEKETESTGLLLFRAQSVLRGAMHFLRCSSPTEVMYKWELLCESSHEFGRDQGPDSAKQLVMCLTLYKIH